MVSGKRGHRSSLLASDYIVVAASASAGTAPCNLHARPPPPLRKVCTLPSANAADSHGSILTLRPARELVRPTTRPRATTQTSCGSESTRRRDGACRGARAHRRDRREPGYVHGCTAPTLVHFVVLPPLKRGSVEAVATSVDRAGDRARPAPTAPTGSSGGGSQRTSAGCGIGRCASN